MSPVNWVHIRGTVNGQPHEKWISLDPFRSFATTAGRVEAYDEPAHRRYQYEPHTRTLTIGYLAQRPGGVEDGRSLLAQKMERWQKAEKQGRVKVSKADEAANGRTCTVFTAVEGDGTTGQIVADGSGERILSVVIRRAENGAPGAGGQDVLEFDYPDEGPADIYALGVPRDARIIDQHQAEKDLTELSEKITSARESFAPAYYAIIYEGTKGSDGLWYFRELTVAYKNGGRCRIETYGRPLGDLGTPDAWRRLRELAPSDDAAALEACSKTRLAREICIEGASSDCDGWRLWLDADGRLQRESWRGALLKAVEGRNGQWALPVLRSALLPPKEGPWGSLVGVQCTYPSPAATFRHYHNPARDYVLEEATHASQAGVTSRRVLEYAQTPQGKWYAKRIEESGGLTNIVVIHLDTERDIPDEFFNPDRVTREALSRD